MPTFASPSFRYLLLATGFFLTFCFSATTAHAGNKGTVLVITAGEDSDRALLDANASAALREEGIAVALLQDAELNGFELNATIVCLEQGEECSDLVRKAPAQWLLLLRLRHDGEGADADQRVIANLFSADDGELLQVKQRICQRCSSRERMAKVIAAMVADMAKAELAYHATETYLTVNCNPVASVLSIDGKVVGPTGQPYQVTPGEHKISVQHPGFHDAAQDVLVAANEHKNLSVTLANSATKKSSKSNLRSILGWSAIGVGAGAAVAGVYGIVIDGNDVNPDRFQQYNTKVIGIASTATGLALAGTALYLLYSAPKAKDNDAMAVSATPLRNNGFSIGLSGHF